MTAWATVVKYIEVFRTKNPIWKTYESVSHSVMSDFLGPGEL